MGNIKTLFDKEGHRYYPVTGTKAVFDQQGRDLEERLDTDRRAIESRMGNIYAEVPLTPENFPDIDVLTRQELKMDLFIDMWNEAWGEYGNYDPDNAPDPQHPFMGNKLWFTYGEAVAIYQQSYAQNLSSLEGVYKEYRLPTVLPLRIPTHEVKGTGVFQSASGITRVSIIGPHYGTVINLSEASSMFANCTSLEEVVCNTHILHAAYHDVPPADIFYNCIKLKEIRFYCDKVGFDIHWSPLLSLASVQSFIPPKAVPNGATITVHPEVYAKLTDKTNTEWNRVLTDAVAKNITFETV